MPPLSLYARARTHSPLRTRPRVQRAPGIPCALPFSRADPYQDSGASRREIVKLCALKMYSGRKAMKFQRLLIALSRESSVIRK
jgi:hypothetical protein